MEISNISWLTEGSFSVVQFRAEECDTLDYISVNSAVKQGKLEITEVNEGGAVNTILVKNSSEKCVFISEGDLLQGAKQNRVLITSVFLMPQSKFNLPVNCVEQGRWSRRSKNFTPHKHSAPMDVKKNLRNSVSLNLNEERGHYADQMRTWDTVSSTSERYRSASSTEDLLEIMQEKTKQYENKTKNFLPDENANSLVIFYGGEPVDLECYNRRDIYAEYFRKVVLSAYDDYECFYKKEHTPAKGELEYKTLELLDVIQKFEKKLHKGVAAGEEKRFRDDITSGFELVFENRPVHLSVLKEYSKRG